MSSMVSYFALRAVRLAFLQTSPFTNRTPTASFAGAPNEIERIAA
jgi:hypothetical protein